PIPRAAHASPLPYTTLFRFPTNHFPGEGEGVHEQRHRGHRPHTQTQVLHCTRRRERVAAGRGHPRPSRPQRRRQDLAHVDRVRPGLAHLGHGHGLRRPPTRERTRTPPHLLCPRGPEVHRGLVRTPRVRGSRHGLPELGRRFGRPPGPGLRDGHGGRRGRVARGRGLDVL